MDIRQLIEQLAALVRQDAATLATVDDVTDFDVSRGVDDPLRNGMRILRELRLSDGSVIDLMHMPDDGEWTLMFRDDGGPRIDPTARWGQDQALKMSPTGKGYAVLFRSPLPTTLTASTPHDRLQTISVRRQ